MKIRCVAKIEIKLIRLFSNHLFANARLSDFKCRFLELFMPVFFFSLLVGGWSVGENNILKNHLITSIKGNINLEALTVLFLLTPVLFSLRFILNRFNCLLINLGVKWFTTCVTFMGFSSASAVTGVFLGLSLPIYIDNGSLRALKFIILGLLFIPIQLYFLFLTEAINYKIPKDKKDGDEISYSLFIMGTLILGGILFFILQADIDIFFPKKVN